MSSKEKREMREMRLRLVDLQQKVDFYQKACVALRAELSRGELVMESPHGEKIEPFLKAPDDDDGTVTIQRH